MCFKWYKYWAKLLIDQNLIKHLHDWNNPNKYETAYYQKKLFFFAHVRQKWNQTVLEMYRSQKQMDPCL